MAKKFFEGLAYLTLVLGLLRVRNFNELDNIIEIVDIIEGPTFIQSPSSYLVPNIQNTKFLRDPYSYDSRILNDIIELVDYVPDLNHQLNVTALLLEIQLQTNPSNTTVAQTSNNLGTHPDELRNIFPGTSLTKDDINLIDNLWQEDIVTVDDGSREEPFVFSSKSTFPMLIDEIKIKDIDLFNFQNQASALFPVIDENLATKTNDSFDENDQIFSLEQFDESYNLTNVLKTENQTNANLSSFLPTEEIENDLETFLKDLKEDDILDIDTPEVNLFENEFDFSNLVDVIEPDNDPIDNYSDSGVSSREHEDDESSYTLSSHLSYASGFSPNQEDSDHDSNYNDLVFANQEIDNSSYDNSLDCIVHDHTYCGGDNLVPRNYRRNPSINNTNHQDTYAPIKKTKRVNRRFSPVPVQQHCRTRDEKAAKKMKIPLTLTQVIDSTVEEFNDIITDHPNLNEDQLKLIRDIRRRGKNKIAAQNCRKRKLNVIDDLEKDVNEARKEKQRVNKEQQKLKRQLHEANKRLQEMTRRLFPNIPRSSVYTSPNANNYNVELDKNDKPYLVMAKSNAKKS